MAERYAVIGLGRFGRQLARALTQAGVEVIAIDRDRQLIEQIADEVTQAVRLDSTDEDALRGQGIDQVDAAVVGIGEDFESNVLTTVLLKSLGVGCIYARADHDMHARILKRVGADEIIFPEEEAAQRWAYRLVAPQIGEKLEFAPGFSVAQYGAPPSFEGKTLLELQLRKKHRVNIIGIRSRGQDEAEASKNRRRIVNVPQPESIIHAGDLLWLVGSDEDLAALPDK